MWNGIRERLLDSVPKTATAEVEILPQQSIIDLHRTIRKLLETAKQHEANISAADHWLTGAKAEHEQIVAQERASIARLAEQLSEAQDAWRKITEGDLGIAVQWPSDPEASAASDVPGKRGPEE